MTTQPIPEPPLAIFLQRFRLALADLGLPVPDNRAASYVIGLGLQDAMQAAMPDLDPRHYPRMVERYKHHY